MHVSAVIEEDRMPIPSPHVAERALPRFPFTPVDPLIVGRLNPRDPVA